MEAGATEELLWGDLTTIQVGESPSTMHPTPVTDTTHEGVTEGVGEVGEVAVVVVVTTDVQGRPMTSTNHTEGLRLRIGSPLRPVHQASVGAYLRLLLRHTMEAVEARPLRRMGLMETMVALLEIPPIEVHHNNHLPGTRATRAKEEDGGPTDAEWARTCLISFY